MRNKAKIFRKLLNGKRHFTLMEAHNGLSAKIVEEAGFPAIWASGLAISASLGVRDNNEISHTQLIDVLEFMNDACSIPILVDGDTGYGNFNNARLFIEKLENRGIAAVCLEDKKFPKTNSFLEDDPDNLAPIDEFVGKIKAVKDAQRSPDFTLVARLEALIVHAGMDEAVRRATAYAKAGVDALLIHSKQSDGREIYEFLERFDLDIPIFLIPTKYYSEPVPRLTRDRRVRGLVWANHNVRACLARMRQVCARIRADGTIAGVEDSIATVAEVFEIQGNDEYFQAERKYLPAKEEVRAFIMAAGSPRLPIDIPKAMIAINGRTILERQVAAFRANGITDITVVSGYGGKRITGDGFRVVENRDWETTSAAHSIALALGKDTDKPCVITFGDVFFKRYLLREMFEYHGCDVVTVCVRENYIRNNYAFTVNEPASRFEENVELRLVEVRHGDDHPKHQRIMYFSGLMFVRNPELVASVLALADSRRMDMEQFFRRLLGLGAEVGVIFTTTDSVVDVNTAQDLLVASGLD